MLEFLQYEYSYSRTQMYAYVRPKGLYCSRECQKSHWKVHKLICRQRGRERQAAIAARSQLTKVEAIEKRAASRNCPECRRSISAQYRSTVPRVQFLTAPATRRPQVGVEHVDEPRPPGRLQRPPLLDRRVDAAVAAAGVARLLRVMARRAAAASVPFTPAPVFPPLLVGQRVVYGQREVVARDAGVEQARILQVERAPDVLLHLRRRGRR